MKPAYHIMARRIEQRPERRRTGMELKAETFKKILPLPVTVITTVNASGIANAAPYSCVMPILRPLDLIAIASALPRDTLYNIRETREFVVNIIGRPRFKEAMQTAKNYPPGVNELEVVGLDTVPSNKITPPRIKDAIGWIEAVLDEEILREKFSLIIGKVICAEINDEFLQDGRLNELPAVMLRPDYRVVGENVIGDVEETIKLFLP
jgi:flavin reductase (DIM6/NTAB) family NADH-FMN oxidoreductase RutF